MKGLIPAILLLLVVSEGAISQTVEKDILGAWLPISVKNWEGQYSSPTPVLLLVFEQGGKGLRKGTGSNLVTLPFSYRLDSNSLEWNFEENIFKTQLPELQNDLMTIRFDSSYVADYIRLPQIDAGAELSELKEALENQTWELTLGSYREPISILYQFEDHVLDSGLTDHRLWSKDLGLRTYHFGIIDAIKQSWTVSQHGETLILRIDRGFSSIGSFTLLLKSFSNDFLTLSYWEDDEEQFATMKRLHKPSAKESKKKLKWLTQTKWQFQSEYIPPPDTDTTNIIDLGMVIDDFEELDDGGYKHDSTAVIQQTDLDEKLLLLDFQQNGAYRIWREDRILDEGTWKYFFNQTVIQLISNKEPHSADGMYGGDIKIASIRNREIKLYRNLKQLLNDNESDSYSHLETYKPYRKQK
ncbi:MAG: hypothetical protein Roseis2KO_55090 [Roseivirga sp.]